jgi:ketosteroid isomerase-like protein
MAGEENKALARRFFAAQNRGAVESMLACWPPNAVNHGRRAADGPPLRSCPRDVRGSAQHASIRTRHVPTGAVSLPTCLARGIGLCVVCG